MTKQNSGLIKKARKELKKNGPKSLARKTVRFAAHKADKSTVGLLSKISRRQKFTKDDEFYFVGNPIFQITQEDIDKSIKTTSAKKPKNIKSATWFVPYFDHLSFGGIFTIFRFIEHLDKMGVANNVLIYDRPTLDVPAIENEVKDRFPYMKRTTIGIFDPSADEIDDIPETDIAFCTFWVSAYLLLKFNKTKRKYYFVQDYEPLFYPGGATFALAESTYRFGFQGVVNTPGLLAAVNKRHGMQGVSFIPAVDRSIYYPAKKIDNKKIRIFFYARPNNPRNAFNLGVQIIKQLLDQHRSDIEIITAGAQWKESEFGLKGKIKNLGLLNSLDEVAELYRSCDIGFVYMLSKHPSYQPFEFMASGMATVTNNNEDNLWFLRHEDNCLVSEPSPAAMVEQINRLVKDNKLREKIIENGLKTVENEWAWQLDTIWNDIKKSPK